MDTFQIVWMFVLNALYGWVHLSVALLRNWFACPVCCRQGNLFLIGIYDLLLENDNDCLLF